MSETAACGLPFLRCIKKRRTPNARCPSAFIKLKLQHKVANVLNGVLNALLAFFALPSHGVRFDREVAVIIVLIQYREECAPVDGIDACRRVVVVTSVCRKVAHQLVLELRVTNHQLAVFPL